MLIKSLNISNLRNISSATIEPHPEINIFHGDNGAGKTSIIEALVVLAKGRSFRSGQFTALVGPDGERFRLVATLETDGGLQRRIGLERSLKEWTGRIDGRDVTQFSELSAHMPLVLVEPNSHLLVSGTPDVRRRFLDWGVFHVKPGYLAAWRDYARGVRQRNAALRQGDERLVRSLDPQLVRHGEVIDAARRQQVALLEQGLESLGAGFHPGGNQVSMAYEPGWRGAVFAEALQQNLKRDLERGATLAGPHRADLGLSVEGVAVRDRLSRGEQKLLASALLLAQGSAMKNVQPPLLLLDDLASEFDQKRLADVIRAGRDLGAQLWLTGTEVQDYLAVCPQERRVFHVEQGRVAGAKNA